jgi:multidrug efflux pump
MPPPIQGLGNGSGYSLFLQDRAGLGYAALQQALEAFQAEIAKTPGMTYPVSSYQSNIPQLEVKVDRIKAKAQGVALTDCSRPCRPIWARSTSTTSTPSAASGA